MSKVATKTLEFNVVEHCNLSCKGCSHLSPHFPRTYISIQEFETDLKRLSRFLHAQELKIIGGEPLLHPQLSEILRLAQEIEIADWVTISTNGTLLHKMSEAVWMQADRIRVSLYPGVKVQMPIDEMKRLAQLFKVSLVVDEVPVFKHTILSHRNTDAGLVQKIYSECAMPNYLSCHTLRHGVLHKCSPSAYIPDAFGKENLPSDGLAIHEAGVTTEIVSSFLSEKKMLSACAFCLGTSGKTFACEQVHVKPGPLPKTPQSARELVNLFNTPSGGNPSREELIESYQRKSLI